MTTTHAIPLSEQAGLDTGVDRRTAPVAKEAAAAYSIGSIMVFAVAVTSLLFFLLTASVVGWLSGDATFGVAMGLFCAVWGGPGFGAMAGGTIWHLQQTATPAADG